MRGVVLVELAALRVEGEVVAAAEGGEGCPSYGST